MYKKSYKEILKQIKKYNTIVIARHVGADPDALASQIALKDIIVNRGNCNLALKQLGMFDMQFPAKLSYGQTTTVVTTGKTFMEPCKNVLEVEVVTNKGNWKVNP